MILFISTLPEVYPQPTKFPDLHAQLFQMCYQPLLYFLLEHIRSRCNYTHPYPQLLFCQFSTPSCRINRCQRLAARNFHIKLLHTVIIKFYDSFIPIYFAHQACHYGKCIYLALRAHYCKTVPSSLSEADSKNWSPKLVPVPKSPPGTSDHPLSPKRTRHFPSSTRNSG